MIKLENVRKSFGRQLVLDNISLAFEEEKIYGLFGRNGVGKTTLLNIMATQIFHNEGSITVDEENPFSHSRAREKICFIKESGFGVNIKVKDIFKYAKEFYPNWDEGLKDILVSRFEIPVRKTYEKLSKGNKTLVGLITGLASRAPYTFFDEPSLGLDAANRYAFYEILL